jgi:large subunit ribosomal protein L15
MPLQRRVPKRGFHNPAKKVYTIVNLRDIDGWALEEVSPRILVERRIVERIAPDGLKVLGMGELNRAVTVRAHRISAQAAAKISRAGGKPVIIEPPAEKAGTGGGDAE